MNRWEERDLSSLTAAEGWHVDDAAMLAKLETSLRRFGQLSPLVVHGATVVGGRNLLRAMLHLGWEKAMCVTISDEYDPLQVSLATDIKFDFDYAHLAKMLSRREHGEAYTLASISPFSQQRIEHFEILADFNWDDFRGGDDQQSLWEEGDLASAKGQAGSPRRTPGAPTKVDRPSRPVTSSDRKMAPKPPPLQRPAPLTNQVHQPAPQLSLVAPQPKTVLADVQSVIKMIEANAEFAPHSVLTPEMATGAFAPQEPQPVRETCSECGIIIVSGGDGKCDLCRNQSDGGNGAGVSRPAAYAAERPLPPPVTLTDTVVDQFLAAASEAAPDPERVERIREAFNTKLAAAPSLDVFSIIEQDVRIPCNQCPNTLRATCIMLGQCNRASQPAATPLVVTAPQPPKRVDFSELVNRQPSNVMPSVLFAGHEEPAIDPHWRPAPPPSLDGDDAIEFDTETNGLRWFKGDRPVGIAIRRRDGSKHYVSWGHAGGNNCDEGTARRWAQRELRGKHLTAANAKFEVHQMREWGVDLEEIGCTLSDVLHMAPLLDDSRRKWSLDTVSEEYLREKKSGEDLDKTRMAEYHASIVAPYAMRDVELTGRCRDAMWPHLDAQDMHVVRRLEESIIYAVAEMERNAAPIDVDLLHRWVAESEREVHAHLKDLVDGCGFMMDPEKDSSWLRLFDKLGLKVTHFTEHGAPSFADAVIRSIPHPMVQKARRVMKLNSLRSKFLLPYLDEVAEYGMVRFNLHQLRGDKNGTVRGRFSASEQNIQQVFNAANQRKAFGYDEDDASHDDEIYLIRKLFIAGSASHQVLSSDAAQIEYRIMAHLAEDPKMLKAYADNPLISYHDMVWDMVRPFRADLVYSKVKILNFMLMYGGGKDKTAETLEMPRSESDAFVALYKEAFPYTDALFKRVMRQAETEGMVSTLLGRRARFPGGKFAHAALNAIIQGTAADIMKIKIAELHAARKKTGLVMRMTVHDEVCGDAPRGSNCKAEVDAVLNEQSISLKVPILWKTSLAENWADC